MTNYPLIVRNRTPWSKAGLLLLWVGGLVIATIAADRPLAGHEALLPYFLALFWLIAVIGLIAVVRQEHPALIVDAPGQASVVRGPLYARRTVKSDHLELRIEKDWDSEGGTYFKLRLADYPIPLTIAEGNHRERLDQLKAAIETVFAG